MHLAIDPGEDTGWSLFDSKRLIACGLGDPRVNERVRVLDTVLIERPVIYPRMKARPNDIVTLALGAGEWAGIFRAMAPVEYIEPFRWKGKLSKKKHHPRIVKRLESSETVILQQALGKLPPSVRHNVIDAVGLGLFMVGRNANAPRTTSENSFQPRHS